MRVIDFEAQFWFFLTNEDNFFIDVNCSNSFVGFGRLIKLNELEISHYKLNGKNYLNQLANDIQYYALTKYSERNIVGEIDKQVHQTIMKFTSDN